MPLTKIEAVPEPPPIEQKSEERRLWIGNLDTFVSEYQLLKILQKHGQMEKFDLMFYRCGPLAGQPRGYAFVTYSSKEEAEKVKNAMDGKKIGTKNIAVRWAHNLKVDEPEKIKDLEIPALAGGKHSEQKISRTTKIQAIEAKLKMMESSSTSEFQLTDVPSIVNVSSVQRSASKGRAQKSYNKPKFYSKPYHRR